MFRVFEEINTFIQQECIKLIKSDHKDISNKDFHFRYISVHRSILKSFHKKQIIIWCWQFSFASQE